MLATVPDEPEEPSPPGAVWLAPPRPARAERAAGHAGAATLVAVDLLPGTKSYVDSNGDVPMLVADAGCTEVHFTIPYQPVTLADLRLVDELLDAVAQWRIALIAHL